MKKSICSIFLIVMLVGVGYAQDEFIPIMDFEIDLPSFPGWVVFGDFTSADEPIHSGESAAIMEIEGTGGWNFGSFGFPAPVDLSETDEIHTWVNADDIFQMNLEFGGQNLGYRGYTEDDIGNWKELIWWYPEEATERFGEIGGWGSFINPAASGGFPEDFVGTIFMDDVSARIRKAPPAREYFLINGFNSEDDLANVTVNPDYDGGIETGGDPPPTEGDGYLVVFLSDASNNRFSIDLTDVPEILEYDRFHFDVFLDGAGSWGNFDLSLTTSIIDDAGNDVGISMTLLNGSYNEAASQQWFEFVAQYGPVEGTEGFAFQNLREESIAPVFSTEGATLSIGLSTNGGGVEESPLYVDNIRLSREVGTHVEGWELY